MKGAFESIYRENAWGRGSGAGSMPRFTKKYRRFLQHLLSSRQIRSVVDVGCGDWQSSTLIDWSGIQYRGFDVVPDVIETNRRLYSRSNIQFEVADLSVATPPPADLIIVKEVLQHWSTAAILAFLPRLEAFKYALITNSVSRAGTTNNDRDIPDGGCRDLDLMAPPFSVRGREVLSYAFPGKVELVVRTLLRRWHSRISISTVLVEL